MTSEEVHQSILEWSTRSYGLTLELPNGMFGWDNQHTLTWSAALSHKVLLELDSQQLLILTEPAEVVMTGRTGTHMEVRGCSQVTFDWQGYGDLTPHLEHFTSGTVTLHWIGPRPN